MKDERWDGMHLLLVVFFFLYSNTQSVGLDSRFSILENLSRNLDLDGRLLYLKRGGALLSCSVLTSRR